MVRDSGWVLPSLIALTERCFIGQLAQLSAPMPWPLAKPSLGRTNTPEQSHPWLQTLPPRRDSMIGLGDNLNSGTP